MASEKTGYSAFPSYPVTGPATSPAFALSGSNSGAGVTLGGTSFSVQVQVSNALNPGPGPDHLFVPPNGSFDTYTTLTAGNPPLLVPGPIRWIRLVLDSGTLTGGNIVEQQDTTQNLRDLVGTIGQQAGGTINWTTGDHTTLPLSVPGLYQIVTGDEAGQKWQVSGGVATRRSELEPISPTALTNLLTALTSTGAAQSRTVYLEPGTYTLPAVTLPDNITLVGVPGKTILKPPAGAHAPDLDKWITVSAGRTATFRDIILDGNNQYCYGIFVNGSLDYIGGQVINFLGTSGNGAFALTQNSISSHMSVIGTYFTGIHAPPDGAQSNAVGASRAIYFTGLNGYVERCIFDTVGDFEDGDPIHYFKALDATDGWTSAGRGRVINCTFINFGKRGVKIQASDVEVSGSVFTNTITDVLASPHTGIEVFGSRCFIHDNVMDLARSTYGIIVSYTNAHDNKIVDNHIRNGVDGAYTVAREGNSLTGIFDIGRSTYISGNTVESSLYAAYLYTGAVNSVLINNRLIGRQAQVVGNNSTGATIMGNNIGGSPDYATSVGIYHDTASTTAVVKNNTFSDVIQGQRLVGAATGHTIGPQTYRSVTTPVGYLTPTGINTVADSTGYQTPLSASMDAPSFELLMPTGQLNPHFDRDHSDALENAAHRLTNIPVVNVTGVNNGTSSFTALGLLAHSGLQGGMPVDFGAGAPSAYPMVAEVDFGTQSIAVSNGSTRFYPALLFSKTPTGLTSVVIEVDTGSGYATMSTTTVNADKHVRLPGFTAATAIKKIRYTLNGTTPGSGTFIWRRVLLQYPELGATQNKHPSWSIFRAAHNSDGTHLGATPTLDFPSIAAGASATLTVTIGGVLASDGLAWQPPSNLPDGLIARVYWSATSTVTVKLYNATAGAIDPPSGGWAIKIVR